MNTSLIEILIAAQFLTLIALVTALPWVAAVAKGALTGGDIRSAARVTGQSEIGRVIESYSERSQGSIFGNRDFWSILGVANLGGLALFGYLLFNYRSPERLAEYGRLFGMGIHVNLIVDAFVLGFAALLGVWPKGGAVALAAFRESVRQPMFWIITLLTTSVVMFSIYMPYFTFGEDYKMMKQMGFDIVMFASILFGLISVSISIHEEIEGKTAITVMSKPISRRQFLIGKYLGILLACGAMNLILGWVFTLALHLQPEMNSKLDEVTDFLAVSTTQIVAPAVEKVSYTQEGRALMRGAGTWFGEAAAHHLGMLLTFGQVMVLLAISAALATRMQFSLNIVICVLVFLLGHLAPVLVEVTNRPDSDSKALLLVSFIAKLFNVVFPALDYFQVGPAIIRDNPIPIFSFIYYVLTVLGYAILYSSLAILGGLLMFEDRDLA